MSSPPPLEMAEPPEAPPGAAALVRCLDWSATPLGPSAAWPASLRTLVEVILGSAQPMFVVWGPTLRIIYNDAYAALLARKHPGAMGQDFLEVWHEIRADLLPIVETAYRGEPVHMDHITLLMERRGFREEAHFSFSYTPVRDEAGAIAGFFCACAEITGQVVAERRLRDSEAKFQAITNSIDQMIWSTRADGFHDYFNERWYEFTGAPPGSTDGEAWQALFHPDDRPQAQQAWRRSLASGEPYYVEYRLRHASGAWRWVVGRARCVRDDAGRITRWFGTCTDIHNLKATEAALAEALEAKEALLYEVNHRVKNNLQVITGLLTLQASRSTDPALRRDLDDARTRIGVVAAIHQSLYTTAAHSEVEMRGFLRTLAEDTLRSLGDPKRIALRFSGEGAAVLPLTQALPLALVISELLTNAVKYAFPDGRAGEIRIDVGNDGPGLRVTVADDGVGLPGPGPPGPPAGIGMKIIGVLTRQLRASMQVIPSERGAAFQVTLPPR